MIRNFDEVLEIARKRGPKKVALACAEDVDALKAINEAKKTGIVEAILVGDEEKIKANAKAENIDITQYEIVHEGDMVEASRKAVELVSTGKAHMVMKGLVDTSIILKAVLDKEIGLRTGNPLSHVALFQVPGFDKMHLVTDAAMTIAPDLEGKKALINNVVPVANALDIQMPKVAVICAKEKANPKMPDTMDAQALQEMNEKGEIKDCIVGGPLALDNAVSKKAAEIKGIDHPVAGDADILLTGDIEAGNVLYKSMIYFGQAKNAGVIVGAKAPIVLTSRADSDEAKLYSIALGVLCAAEFFDK
ncbi:phosphate butyryltransferase [Isachenkonia alkalipeptolytica]|uniref:Phosphate butyryltransferase n=1 Tax=Isachenkonia alkalipeptolytica TaxID=2565777 RepID=A0AA43XN58_9CLOT|nr:phosphate butyryltransferase [Isachenkonia alkalipeptolytica]NBG89566.1 phosphate butyryltransferase [Isachenkonia alkalipeptolytica]